jgi:dTDP-4-dehydrorhamnose 3,5-epimerase
MRFIKTKLNGAYLIEIDPIRDERGFFATSYCEQQFMDHDLETRFPYTTISFNYESYVLRGLHYQIAPHQQAKLVRCVRGSIYDVIIDLREDSETYCQWFGAYLTDTNNSSLYIPEDFAHGFLTMERSSTVLYQLSEGQNKQAERGIRFDDVQFCISWPKLPKIISDKDTLYFPFRKGIVNE